MRFLGKKGISPLIASILLIGFTVALAAVVITWGGGFVQRITSGTEERTEKSLLCTSDLSFEIIKVTCPAAGNPRPNGTILIDNKANFDITSFAVRSFDDIGDLTGNTVISGLNAFEVKSLTAVLPAGTSRVEALATIELETGEVTCSEAPRTKTFTPSCA